MTKQEIIDHLTYKCGLQHASAIRAVEGVIDSISEALTNGDAVTIRGFATIKPIERAPKIGYDINREKPVNIPACRSVKIILSKELKNRMNNDC